MKIYVVRHGLTKNNKLKLINGQGIDEGLEPEGREQAEQAALQIPEGVTRMFVSDMLRTRQTAEIINRRLRLPISHHPELREVHFGAFTGRAWKDLESEGLALRQHYYDTVFDYSSHGGESAEGVRARVAALLGEIKEKHSDEKVVLVSHGGIVRMLYRIYHDKQSESAENCSIHEFEI